MADLLTMSIEAKLTDTAGLKTFWTWPYLSGTTSGHEFTDTPDEHKFLLVDAPITTGVDVNLADLTTVSYLMVHNLDGANFITVTRKNAAAATVVDVVLAGQCMITADVDPTVNPTIIGDTGTVRCAVAVLGT